MLSHVTACLKPSMGSTSLTDRGPSSLEGHAHPSMLWLPSASRLIPCNSSHVEQAMLSPRVFNVLALPSI